MEEAFQCAHQPILRVHALWDDRGCTNVIIKGLVELFHSNEDHHWSRVGPYLIILTSICLAVSQIIFLNKTLEAYNAVYAVPVVNACLVIWGTFGGIILFQQYKVFDTFAMVGVPTGVLISAYGIVLLSKEKKASDVPMFGDAPEMAFDTLENVENVDVEMNNKLRAESETSADRSRSCMERCRTKATLRKCSTRVIFMLCYDVLLYLCTFFLITLLLYCIELSLQTLHLLPDLLILCASIFFASAALSALCSNLSFCLNKSIFRNVC